MASHTQYVEEYEEGQSNLDQEEDEDDVAPGSEVSQVNVLGRAMTVETTFAKHDEQECTYTLNHQLKDGEAVAASASSLIIHKDGLKGRWHSQMDIESVETSTRNFATTLFDNGGRVRRELIRHPTIKGTGVWLEDLDDGSLLYIISVEVKADERGKGYASWMIEHMLQDKYASKCKFAYTWPVPFRQGEGSFTESEFSTLTDRADNLFRKFGFRRVGRTCFLCYARDLDHCSKRLLAKDDVSQLRRSKAEADACPLNNAIANEKDDAALVRRIEQLLKANPANIRKADEMGMTPLHVAAQLHRPVIIDRLLKSAMASDLLAHTWDGQTPLDCLEATIASEREHKAALGVPWTGSTEDVARSKWLLLQAMGKTTVSAQNAPVWEQYRYGCTCGQCIEGYISPAMQFRIKSQCEFTRDVHINDAKRNEPGARGALYLSVLESHFPEDVRLHFGKGFIIGIRAILRTIVCCLDKQEAPTSARVEASLARGGSEIGFFEYQAYTKAFLSQGGRVSNVLGGLLFSTHEAEPLGDNSFLEDYEDELVKLPVCANDRDWTLVRHKLAISNEDFFIYG